MVTERCRSVDLLRRIAPCVYIRLVGLQCAQQLFCLCRRHIDQTVQRLVLGADDYIVSIINIVAVRQSRFVTFRIRFISAIILTVDEYETIRLLDKKGYSQEQCAVSMQIARTTVQRIYEIARKKIADALIDGHPLRIEGGDFRICDGQSSDCNLGGCYKQELYQKYAVEKGEGIMRIAVTYENGQIFQHFGHTETFKIYDVEEGKVVHSEVVDTNGSGHGALAGVLNALNADVLICGGIGGGAQTALAAAGIKLFGGVSGDADEAVEAFINETLAYNPNVKCSHHEHNHGEGHTCGEH